MCGIAGQISPQGLPQREPGFYDHILSTMTRRGPDQEGSYFDAACALLHRRLSVIDPGHGRQPMTLGGKTIVYNGELYNAPELRQELTDLGETFDTASDTEVLLRAYLRWGDRCPKKLNGIFAFAVYDPDRRRLFLARDPIGVKPLFYAQRGGSLFFASELKSLLCFPEIFPVVDARGLYDLLFLGPGRTPGYGVFRGVYELEPGTCGYFDETGLHISRYWQLHDAPCTDTFEEASEKTRYLLEDSIRRQLVSDVPIGTFLSGGLDSSIISSVAAKYLGHIDTYSVDYRDNARYFRANHFQPNSDSDYIGLMEEYLGAGGHRIILDTDQLVSALFEAAEARDLPGMADVDSSMLLLCRATKKSSTVILSGECADEIFGGYPWYHRQEILFADTFPWSRSVDVRQSLLRPGLLPEGADYVQAAYRRTVADTEVLDTDSPLEKRMRQMFRLNTDWFMHTLLMRKDALSMHSSLEVRVPFCDWRLVEYAYNMPWALKSPEGREKGVLRKAFEGELPYQIAWRKKSPYPKTFNPAYFARVKALAEPVLTDTACPLYELLNRDAVVALCQNPDTLREPWYGQLMRGAQVVAYVVQIYGWVQAYGVTFDL